MRHPIRVPIFVRPLSGAPAFPARVGDLSQGGLSFLRDAPLPERAALEVELPVQAQRFTLTGRVVRCAPVTPEGFEIGLAFDHPTHHFRLKLAEQVLRIQRLRAELSARAGAPVTEAQAAEQWVARYAKVFADLYPRPRA